jgi:uracil-DNA glycosylase
MFNIKKYIKDNIMFEKKELLKNVKKTWIELLDNYELDKIIEKLNTYNSYILPTNNKILNAFKYFELKDTKVCWIGQDPYIGCHQAMGLSFSVPTGCLIPPSLKNIFKELNLNDHTKGDLTLWVENNNFLMLNTSLTVFEGKSNSNQDLWKNYTDNLIKEISNKTKKIIFLLLGNYAQSKIKFIDEKKHIIIKGVHPSPLSAHRGFLGSGIFNELDDKYKEIFKKDINWEL